jgi:hypothetical protein
MATYNYLLGGTWTCAASLPTLRGQPAKTIHESATYEATPGNTLHSHVTSPGVAGDDYFGYDAKSGSYWHADLDTATVYSWSTSRDGITYAGHRWNEKLANAKILTNSTFEKVSPNQFHDRTVFFIPGGQITVTAVCTR